MEWILIFWRRETSFKLKPLFFRYFLALVFDYMLIVEKCLNDMAQRMIFYHLVYKVCEFHKKGKIQVITIFIICVLYLNFLFYIDTANFFVNYWESIKKESIKGLFSILFRFKSIRSRKSPIKMRICIKRNRKIASRARLD